MLHPWIIQIQSASVQDYKHGFTHFETLRPFFVLRWQTFFQIQLANEDKESILLLCTKDVV